jgi:hypothetical protein
MGSVPEALRGGEEVGLGRRPASDLEPSEAGEPKAGLVEGELEGPRKPSATWTAPFVTASPPRRASGKAAVLASLSRKKGRCRDSFRFSTGVMRGSGTTVTLPRLGTICTHESTDTLVSKMAAGKAKILSATVSRSAQRWFVSFTVEVDRGLPDRHPRPGTAVGVDVGLKALVTAVDHRGQVIPVPGPRPLRSALRRLRRASRAQSRKQKGSANRQKSAPRLARIHARIANCRGTPRSQLRGDPGGWLEVLPTVPSASCDGSSAPRPARPVGW